ncbi:MAG: transcription elongation factor GreA [Tissierellales bacterium]|jgi:transcription elongation factor GreA|nr:transcription elongation factor GreA [Tissierellales bacterium]
MAEKEVILTKEGLQKLEEELDYLKATKRKEVSERIKIAIGFGDLSENAEYDEAKNEQAQVEERIYKLEQMIAKAEIIDDSKIDKSKVHVGSIVTILDLEENEEVEYTIVGSTEADPFEFKISNDSPVGSALLGHVVDDVVDVQVPDGIVQYKVLKIGR